MRFLYHKASPASITFCGFKNANLPGRQANGDPGFFDSVYSVLKEADNITLDEIEDEIKEIALTGPYHTIIMQPN